MERKPVVIAQEALEKEAAVCEQIKALWASRGRTPRAFVDTYGCQQNEADSERIRGMLRASGYEIVDTEEGADCIVINTCAIREHAETRVYGNVGALVHTKARGMEPCAGRRQRPRDAPEARQKEPRLPAGLHRALVHRL